MAEAPHDAFLEHVEHGWEHLPGMGKLVIVVAVIGAGVVGYLVWKNNQNSAASSTTTGDTSGQDSSSSGTTSGSTPGAGSVPAAAPPTQVPPTSSPPPPPTPPTPTVLQGHPVPAQKVKPKTGTGGAHQLVSPVLSYASTATDSGRSIQNQLHLPTPSDSSRTDVGQLYANPGTSHPAEHVAAAFSSRVEHNTGGAWPIYPKSGTPGMHPLQSATIASKRTVYSH